MTLPGYQLLERVGTSTVWRARALDGREVAIKRAPRDDPHAAARSHREADAWRAVDHPGVVPVLDVVDDGDGVAVVMPWLAGGTLADRLAIDGQLAPGEVARIGAAVAEAVAALHARGAVHGDVKPTNILFDSDRPLLGDLGTVRRRGERGQAHGTAEYLDPAVATGGESTPASDVYSLGVVCYEALAGAPPYAGSSPAATVRAADRGVHIPLAELAPDAPAELVGAVARAMARHPGERWGSAAELAGALRAAAAAGQLGPAAPRGALERSSTRLFGPRPPRAPAAEEQAPVRPRGAVITAVAAALLVVPVAVAAWLRSAAEPAGLDAPSPGGRSLAPLVSAPQGPVEPVTPPSPCDGSPAPAPPPGGSVLLGDLDGTGCARHVVWTGGRLEVPGGPADAAVVYQLGQRGDVPLVGDWDCDGRASPALYRPTTGEVFVFDGFAGPGGELTSRPAVVSGRRHGQPDVVDADGDGCHEVAVSVGGP